MFALGQLYLQVWDAERGWLGSGVLPNTAIAEKSDPAPSGPGF